jgi:hypothetical protein
VGGVHEHSPVECTPGSAVNSRSTPNRCPRFGGESEFATDLHLEDESFSEAAMGWTRGLCIQLASIMILGL